MILAACAALVGMGMAVAPAHADTNVYDTFSNTNQHIDQQYGYNYYYIGDVITPSQTGQLTTIQIPFSLSGPYQQVVAPFSYTAQVQLDLYNNVADAVNNSNLLGSVVVTRTFNNDGQIPAGQDYNVEDQQTLTFDYTSQNITLPSSFVVAYHDDGPGNGGFNVVTQDGVGGNAFATYPDSAGTDAYQNGIPEVGRSLQVRVDIAATPLPASAAMGLSVLGLAGLLTVVRRKRATL
jgi:hypothetical protein